MLTGESPKEIRCRVYAELGVELSSNDLIRDYFKTKTLFDYILVIRRATVLVNRENVEPVEALTNSLNDMLENYDIKSAELDYKCLPTDKQKLLG